MLKYFEKHFGLVVSSGIFFGLVLGKYIEFNSYIITSLLVLMMLISFLKTDLLAIKRSFKRPYFIILLTIGKLFIVPFLIYLIFMDFLPEHQVGLVLLAAVPAAVAGPGIILVLRGNISVGLIVSVLTNLLAPLTIPLVLYLTVGANIDIDVLKMFEFLVLLVLIPFFLAVVAEKFASNRVESFNKYSGGIVAVLCFIFMISVIGPYSEEILGDMRSSIFSLFIVFALSVMFHAFGMVFAMRSNRKMLITSIVTMAYTNAGLGIVLAAKYFDLHTLLLTVFYEIPWAIGIIPMQMLFAKKES